MVMSRSPEGLAPLAEERIDLKGIFLGDVAVRTRSYEAKDVCQRRFGWIVRLETDIGVWKDGLPFRGAVGGLKQEGGSEKRRRAEQERHKSNTFEERPSGQQRLFITLI